MGIFDRFSRKSKALPERYQSKALTKIRREEVPAMIRKTKEPGGDPFYKYRVNKSLPEKYEFGMNCFLDTVEPDVRQAVYEELKKNNAVTLIEDMRSFGDYGHPTLFSVGNLSECIKAHNKVAREKQKVYRIDKKTLVRLVLEKSDLELTFMTKGREFSHATKLGLTDIILNSESWFRQFNNEVQHLGKQKGKCYPKWLWKTTSIYHCQNET